MEPFEIIGRYYGEGSKARNLLEAHSRKVAGKALEAAKRLSAKERLDLDFIFEAAILHDIGIFFTNAPEIGCHGDKPYICHGFRGRELLEKEGLPRHALVCETHIGVGLTVEDIKAQGLPLPLRNMAPHTLEEKIISYADKFFSKGGDPEREKPLAEVRASIKKYGADKLRVFDEWHRLFGADSC